MSCWWSESCSSELRAALGTDSNPCQHPARKWVQSYSCELTLGLLPITSILRQGLIQTRSCLACSSLVFLPQYFPHICPFLVWSSLSFMVPSLGSLSCFETIAQSSVHGNPQYPTSLGPARLGLIAQHPHLSTAFFPLLSASPRSTIADFLDLEIVKFTWLCPEAIVPRSSTQDAIGRTGNQYSQLK